MISPAWASAFASPPAAMALAMAAAGVGGGEGSHRRRNSESSNLRSPRLLSFPTFNKAPEPVETPQTPADKAAGKAAALAAARDQERAAKIGSGRGLGAVAMATAGQRRNLTDKERAKRWSISETMGNMWMECGREGDLTAKSTSGLPHRMFGIVSNMLNIGQKMRSAEVLLGKIVLTFFMDDILLNVAIFNEREMSCAFMPICVGIKYIYISKMSASRLCGQGSIVLVR